MTRTSIDIELVALEAIEKAIITGHIDISKQEAETVAERLYLLLNQYEEENNDLRTRLQRAEAEIAELRSHLK